MNEDIYIQMAIDFARAKNHIWPFSTIVVNAEGEVLVKAADCAHISPLYHAESLAIHVLATQLKSKLSGKLTLFTTAEPDVLSQSAILWGNVVHEMQIHKVCYGASLRTIEQLWPFGIDIRAHEVIERSHQKDMELQGGILESACNALFEQARETQKQINQSHPAEGILSENVDDFYEV